MSARAALLTALAAPRPQHSHSRDDPILPHALLLPPDQTPGPFARYACQQPGRRDLRGGPYQMARDRIGRFERGAEQEEERSLVERAALVGVQAELGEEEVALGHFREERRKISLERVGECEHGG